MKENRTLNTTLIITGVIFISVSSFLLVKHIRNKSKKISCNDTILFLGDSQTATSNGYVERYIRKCGNSKVKKIAQVGAKSEWVLEKYKEDLSKGNTYKWVSVMIGVNDVFARKSTEQTKRNLSELFRLVKSNGSKLLVMSSPSVAFYPVSDETHLSLSNDLEKWLSENKKIDKFIPLIKKTNNASLFQSDGLHINSKGQDVVFNELLKS